MCFLGFREGERGACFTSFWRWTGMVRPRERGVPMSNHPNTREEELTCVCSFERQAQQDVENERGVLGGETKGKV